MGLGPGVASMAADLEKRVKSVLREAGEEDDASHTFAQRAEAYYQKRPELLSLLHHLYASHLSPSLRFCGRRPSEGADVSSDAGSTSCLTADEEDEASYDGDERVKMAVDRMAEEVVMGSVQMNLLVRAEAELRRKVDLQRSLVEVLESERLILLKENASLRYDNQTLAWEAAELGSCLLRLRSDHRRKIDSLQGQIHALRRRRVRKAVCKWWRQQMRRLPLFVCGSGPGLE